MFLAAIDLSLLLDHREDFVFAQNQVLDILDLDLGAGILADQDPIARLDIERRDLAVFVDLALPDGDDLRLHGLFLGGVGDDDSPFADFFLLEPLDEDPIVERTNFHTDAPFTALLALNQNECYFLRARAACQENIRSY